jgi:hypothetical protein
LIGLVWKQCLNQNTERSEHQSHEESFGDRPVLLSRHKDAQKPHHDPQGDDNREELHVDPSSVIGYRTVCVVAAGFHALLAIRPG